MVKLFGNPSINGESINRSDETGSERCTCQPCGEVFGKLEGKVGARLTQGLMESLDKTIFPIIFNKCRIFLEQNIFFNILKVSMAGWLAGPGWMAGWLVGLLCRLDTTYNTYIKVFIVLRPFRRFFC